MFSIYLIIYLLPGDFFMYLGAHEVNIRKSCVYVLILVSCKIIIWIIPNIV